MPGFSQRAGKFRRPTWLRQHRYGPNVFIWRNLETNQVLYSQLPFPQKYNIAKQFRGPNWQNRLPSLRNDLWRPMAVAQLNTYEGAVELYESLVQLRHMRDFTHRKEADAMRKKNDDGNIWYFSQFRPTYTQEAVADVISALEHLKINAKLHWEDEWRRGEESHWEDVGVEHQMLPRYNPRERHVVLRQIADKSYEDYHNNLARYEKERQQFLVQEARIRQKLAAKIPFAPQREGPGGPSKKWASEKLIDGISRKSKEVSKLHSQASSTIAMLKELPLYANKNLRKRLRADAKREFAMLRRVQRELARYRRARAAQRQLKQLKARRK